MGASTRRNSIHDVSPLYSIRGLDAEERAVISSRKITKLYVFMDVASFVCQIFGSAAQASGAEGARNGMLIVMGGLGIQLLAFVCFIGMGALFHRKLNRELTAASSGPHVNWRGHMRTIYAVSTLILARSTFRLIEFAVGANSSLYKTEALIYVFDASLLFATTVCLVLVHPGMLLRSIRKAGVVPLSDNNKSFVPFTQYRLQSIDIRGNCSKGIIYQYIAVGMASFYRISLISFHLLA
jgi:hypothetical protein